jgi:cell division protein FtsW (lipid II flippase)
MMHKSDKILHWLPRILGILAIAFISIFALDAFDPKLTLWQQLVAFAIHLVPSFILLVILIIAWKRELIGGIIFLVIALLFTPLIFVHNFRMNHSIWISLAIIATINLPFIIMGLLFILNHKRKKGRIQKPMGGNESNLQRGA